MKKTLLFCLTILFSLLTFAQSWEGSDLIPLPPDAWNIMKYGHESSVDMYTGTLNVEIPIYRYKDNDFDVPINIRYSTNGFRPNSTTGPLGLGWTLMAGGCITRNINGIADEKSVDIYGSLYHIRPDYTDSPFTAAELIDSTDINYTNHLLYFYEGQHQYESTPDCFSFNFGIHSGKFYLIRDNYSTCKALVFGTSQPAGEYKIVIPGFQTGSLSVIIIYTGDGYEYTFRSLNEDSPYGCYYTRNLDDYSGSSFNTPISWYLTKIKAPNGRCVSFSYRCDRYNECLNPTIWHYSSFENITYSPLFPFTDNTFWTNSSEGSVARYVITGSQDVSLKSIRVKDAGWCLDVLHSEKPKEKYIKGQGATPVELSSSVERLDSIVIRDSLRSRILEKVRFTYSIPQTGNPVLLLKSVSFYGRGSYQMDYYSENNSFPYQGTTSVDHWGYLCHSNPSYNLSYLLPRAYFDSGNDQIIDTTATYRKPDLSSAILGCLKRLHYPTGGYTEYSYDQNTFSSVLRRRYVNNNYPTLEDVSDLTHGGGLRISRIIDNPLYSSSLRIKQYLYESEGISTGILMQYPNYLMNYSFHYDGTGTVDYSCTVKSSTNASALPIDAVGVIYSSVKEVESDGSSKEYRFTSWRDVEYRDSSLLISITPSSLGSYSDDYLNLFMDFDDRHLLRGKIKNVKYYKFGSITPWKEESYEYQNKAITQHPYIKTVELAAIKFYEKLLYLDNFIPIRKDIKYWESNGNQLLREEYTYNALNQLVQVRKRDYNLGTSELSRTLYVGDNIGISQQGIIAEMISANLLSYPLKSLSAICTISSSPEESQYRLKNGSVYNYGTNSSMICLLNKQNTYILNTPLNGWILGDLYTESTYRYNSQNHPIEIRNRAGRPTSIIWGYGGLYPVAVLKNCEYNELTSIEGGGFSVSPLESSLSNFQRWSISQNDQWETTLYEWLPYVGISRITDQSGKNSFYQYDNFGRLIQESDDESQPVTSYMYHVMTE